MHTHTCILSCPEILLHLPPCRHYTSHQGAVIAPTKTKMQQQPAQVSDQCRASELHNGAQRFCIRVCFIMKTGFYCPPRHSESQTHFLLLPGNLPSCVWSQRRKHSRTMTRCGCRTGLGWWLHRRSTVLDVFHVWPDATFGGRHCRHEYELIAREPRIRSHVHSHCVSSHQIFSLRVYVNCENKRMAFNFEKIIHNWYKVSYSGKQNYE